MAKTRYARKISKRKGATKRRANTKRRVIKKKGRSMTKRRGGNLSRTFKRLGKFGFMGVKNAASGIENVATSTKDGANTAAKIAANKTSAATNYAANKTSAATNYATDKASAAKNYAFDKASAAKNYAFDKASAAKIYGKTFAQNRIAAVNAAAAEASCVDVDGELADAMKSLQKANDKVERVKAKQEECNPAYGLNALGI